VDVVFQLVHGDAHVVERFREIRQRHLRAVTWTI
jgi:hypothetical protein